MSTTLTTPPGPANTDAQPAGVPADGGVRPGCTVPVAVASELVDAVADRTVIDPGGGLVGIDGLLGAIDRLLALVVTVLLRLDERDVVAEEGQTLGSWLRSVGRRTGTDAGMLIAAAERLADMPATLTAFQSGALSWGTVRGIVTATRSLTAAQRHWVDTAIAVGDRLARIDGDTIVADAQRLADAARDDLARDRADRVAAAQQVLLQPGLDGGGTMIATLDAETYAAVTSAIAAITHDPSGRRVASNVDALHALARTRTRAHASTPGTDDHTADAEGDDAGGAPATPAAPPTARPEVIVITDLATLANAYGGLDHHETDRLLAAAKLLWPHDRPAPRLTPHAARRLSCDATLRPVLIDDGGQVLGVADAYARVSVALRTALAARDGGCRFPGCHRPTSVCEAHHLIHRIDGGPTFLHNLATLCRGHHRAVHEGGWKPTLHQDGTMTFTRRGVTLHSEPRLPGSRAQPPGPPPSGRPPRSRSSWPDDPVQSSTSQATRPDLATVTPTERDPLPF